MPESVAVKTPAVEAVPVAEGKLAAAAAPAKPTPNADDSGSDDDGDEAPADGAAPAGGAGKKKKKKKSGAAKKKAQKARQAGPAMEQTEPPTVGITKIFPTNVYPVGHILEYPDSYWNE
jgi:methionyl aminopeptidase